MYIWGTHHWKSDKSLGRLRTLYRLAESAISIKKAAIIVANSQSCKEDILANTNTNGKMVRIVYEGLDHQRFNSNPITEQEKQKLRQYGVTDRYILFVSTIRYYKNVHTLIKAFGILCQRVHLPHSLVLAGPVSYTGAVDKNYVDNLKDIAKQYSVLERLKFIGFVPNTLISIFYKGADAYVQPSLHETFGKTVAEALACGVPVVASNTSSTPEVVNDAGILFNPYDPEDLSYALERVLTDEFLRKQLIRKGLERAKLFSFERQARELMQIFAEV